MISHSTTLVQPPLQQICELHQSTTITHTLFFDILVLLISSSYGKSNRVGRHNFNFYCADCSRPSAKMVAFIIIMFYRSVAGSLATSLLINRRRHNWDTVSQHLYGFFHRKWL